MTINIYSEHEDKHFSWNQNYVLCDICAFNGFPNENVVFVIHGFRSEDEDGFVIKFTEYDFPLQRGKIHVHKYNDELIMRLVNQSLYSMNAHCQ